MADEGESYKNLSKIFTFPAMYFAFCGFVFSFIMLETGLAWSRRYLKARALKKIESEIQSQLEEEQKQEGLVTMKQSEYKRKYLNFTTLLLMNITCLLIFFGTDTGYAFAGEKGNDALVLDALAASAQNAVLDKIQNMMAGINIAYTGSQVRASAPLQNRAALQTQPTVEANAPGSIVSQQLPAQTDGLLRPPPASNQI